MAGGLKLFDYRMTEKEYILAETIIEMTDKSELFRTGLEHFDWSEIKVIPTGDRPHDFSYTLKQEAWIELIDAVAAYIKLNPSGEWLSSDSRTYYKENGFRYTDAVATHEYQLMKAHEKGLSRASVPPFMGMKRSERSNNMPA